MSVELLLVIVFVLLPLIQRLLRAAQERQQGEPKPPAGPPPRTRRPAAPWRPASSRRPAPSQVARPPAPMVPPLPSSATSLLEAMTAPAQTAARKSRETASPVPTARRGTRRRRSVPAGLRSAGTLRDAIVLMTVLGPCRALAHEDNRSDRSDRSDRNAGLGDRPLQTSR